jgi:hypothetical protein
MTEALDPSSIAPEMLELLRRIGYADQEELAADLRSPSHTFAKVFYSMLTTRAAYDRIDWEKSVDGGCIAEENEGPFIEGEATAFAVDSRDRFHRTLASSSSPSVSSSHTSRPLWAEIASSGLDAPIEISAPAIGQLELMFLVQAVTRQFGMRWFHPDDTVVIARHEGWKVDVAFRAQAPGLVVQRYHGSIEGFATICRAVQDAVAAKGSRTEITNA